MTDTSDGVVEPRVGPCAPWITASDVQAINFPDDLDVPEDIAAVMAQAASEVLYNLSGQQFTGLCGPVTVRPISRPTDADTRGLVSRMPAGYVAVWGWSSAWGQAASGAAAHYGTSRPPEVELGAFPVVEVQEVKIDGVLIPPNEYQLQDHRTLVRMRPSASTPPTERYGWPTTQIMDLPDTEPGTFSVTYLYGVAPPATGVIAARTLAKLLVLDAQGDDGSVFPQRVTSVSRAGTSVAVADVEDFLSKRMTGIYLLDLFIKTFNPSGAIRKPLAWSPDGGRPRRMPQGVS